MQKQMNPSQTRSWRPIEVLVNLPVAVAVFLVFLGSQTVLLTTLMDPPAHAKLRHITVIWAGVLFHAFAVLFLTMLLGGWVSKAVSRLGRAFLWTTVLVASTLLVWDYISYDLIRQHVFNGARLFWENVFLDRQMMQSRKMPLMITLTAYLAGWIGLTVFFNRCETRWIVLAWRTSLRRLATASLVALALAATSQFVGRALLPAGVYRASLDSNISILRWIHRGAPAEDTLFYVRAPHFHLPPRTEDIDLSVVTDSAVATNKIGRPDIFFFVIESWRRDCANAEVTPRLFEFSRQCLRIDKTVANANQTHYSLTAIVHGLNPFYFETFSHGEDSPGAVPIRVLRNLGYKTKVLASPDLHYFKFANAAFGKDHKLADLYLDQKEVLKAGLKGPAALDEFIVRRLTEEISREPRDEPSFYFVMLDSSHIDYYWGEGFIPRFRPFAERVKVVPLGFNPAEIEPLRNRYKNALAYVDMLMGRVLDAMNERGDLARSIVVVTGDHGEEFLERGHMVHGGEPNHYQLDVPLWIHLPGITNSARLPIASHVDIFPTIFDYLNVRGAFMKCLSGTSLLGPTPPAWAICVQHPGPLPTVVILDCGNQKLWLDIAGGERVGRSVAADYLLGTRLLDAEDRILPAPQGNRSSMRPPENFIPALQQLITYP